jgi:hypothetical protein
MSDGSGARFRFSPGRFGVREAQRSIAGAVMTIDEMEPRLAIRPASQNLEWPLKAGSARDKQVIVREARPRSQIVIADINAQDG